GVGVSSEINMSSILDKKKPNYIQGSINAAEIEAELHRRFAILDIRILKRCMERVGLGEEADEEEEDQSALSQYPTHTDTSTPSSSLVEMFTGLPVSILGYVHRSEVRGFEQARLVFLRAAARLESAKKYFVLDGEYYHHTQDSLTTIFTIHAHLLTPFTLPTLPSSRICLTPCRLRDRPRDPLARAQQALPLPQRFRA
ncbi:hypothetical protein EON64_19965, partial [archaeon]